MASYLSIYRGSEGGAAKLALSQVSASNHPSVDRALRLLSAAWTEVTLLPPSMLRGGWQLPGSELSQLGNAQSGVQACDMMMQLATTGGNSPGICFTFARHTGPLPCL